MVSKNQIKTITGLQQKKYRKEHKMFIAEGVKVVEELLNSYFELHQLFTTQNDFNTIPQSKRIEVTDAELKKISALTTQNTCLAVFLIPDENEILPDGGLIVALDEVRDPGNLGTIIRMCDWFGVTHLVCSKGCVDVYNPKVVQATMGSISRVKVVYTDLEEYLKNTSLPVYGTFMDGENIYTQQLPENGIVVFGNEANGISTAVEQTVTDKIAIPRFGAIQKTESLNVATATAIILSEFRRSFSGK
ncbi:RNA methyltransferase [Flavobacterium beibuense F44-8]|uniref:RNA methyltransferase n=1 Tax=Flavobacterium beibuense F44-8 TaxID=1406840 RepID=A0A0A2LMC1_9FLAO|nr:RNA methyltransferase [Flavobacterium beibuense]KGO80456.1 RNA methyltransferase [Flavobacterium beibuense F44-8]